MLAPAAGVNVSMPASIWALVTTAFARTAVPLSASAPGDGTVTIFTLASMPPSVSSKPKSPAVKVYTAPTPAVTVLLAAVGGVLGTIVPLTRI